MEQGHELTQIAIVVSVALLCGLFLGRLRQPAIVGYILAGVVLGPSALGFVEDRDQINLLAELGVLLLLFSIGMELDVSDFRSVLKFAAIGTGLQITIATTVILLLTWPLGWPWERGVLIGFGIALSSTAVTIKLLEDVGEIKSEVGRRAIAILIAQDLAIVPMMLFIAALAPDQTITIKDVLPLIGSVLILAGLLWFLGRKGKIKLPLRELARNQSDLIAVSAVALCFAAAAVSGLFGMSTAYGAFLAGLLLGNSTDRKLMLRSTLPIQGLLLMVFFLSIGLLIDLGFIWDNLGEIILMLLIVTLGKTAMNVGILRFLKEPWPRAWLGGVALGQVGEFSFVLIALGLSVGALDDEGYRLFVAVIALSLIISPLWLDSARRIERLAVHVDTLRDLMTRLYPLATARTQQSIAWTLVKRQQIAERHAKALPESLADDQPVSRPRGDDKAQS
ncbi:MAG: cation:proton antiporter [Alphaproteobacteria bacterium]|jgi:monovalent cation:H+ antiporter-2, CPA2 family|nr:cation:proton antiporter [Rhodospirillaceae bacterium]MBT6204869.1 cation:proton antiporter [Rhodospirillaceae bacterium]MBT6511997.1 cation:proton antiporter [Rhodospirillaceae bacterium]MBT7648365.1 cation:proton antiporter [Rhodospirillaceae bacterium]MDG2481322.1 cation:proton antiporter [Alphaproteobacteria bacterium]